MEKRKYTSRDDKVMGGVLTIKGTRVMLASIIHNLAKGRSIDDIVDLWEFLDKDTVCGALAELADMEL